MTKEQTIKEIKADIRRAKDRLRKAESNEQKYFLLEDDEKLAKYQEKKETEEKVLAELQARLDIMSEMDGDDFDESEEYDSFESENIEEDIEDDIDEEDIEEDAEDEIDEVIDEAPSALQAIEEEVKSHFDWKQEAFDYQTERQIDPESLDSRLLDEIEEVPNTINPDILERLCIKVEALPNVEVETNKEKNNAKPEPRKNRRPAKGSDEERPPVTSKDIIGDWPQHSYRVVPEHYNLLKLHLNCELGHGLSEFKNLSDMSRQLNEADFYGHMNIWLWRSREQYRRLIKAYKTKFEYLHDFEQDMLRSELYRFGAYTDAQKDALIKKFEILVATMDALDFDEFNVEYAKQTTKDTIGLVLDAEGNISRKSDKTA